MVRAQASPEFLVALMLFLGSSLFVITAVMRAYFLTSGEYRSGLLELNSEKFGRYVINDPGEEGWMDNPNAASAVGSASLNRTGLTILSGMSYPELKRLFGTSYDFRVEIEYLPSYVITVDSASQYLTGWVNMSVAVHDASGTLAVPANVSAVLLGPDTVLGEVSGGPEYGVSFYVLEPGTYRLNLAAIDGNLYGHHSSRLEVLSA